MANREDQSKAVLKINWHGFEAACRYLGPEWDYCHDHETNYLDLANGDAIFTQDSDDHEWNDDPDMNRHLRERVKRCPEQFLEIPFLAYKDDEPDEAERNKERFLGDNGVEYEWVQMPEWVRSDT